MLSQRQRGVVWAVMALLVIWGVAAGGYFFIKKAKMTAEKVSAYVGSVDLSKLSGAARAKAIQELADRINALSYKERQRMRAEGGAYGWFNEMTEEEKAQFIEATMPTGFKQMINAFEEMPEDKRHRAIEDALRRLRQTDDRLRGGQVIVGGSTNRPPVSEELQQKVRTIGLKSFYSQSSAQTKAELAPVLEELQRVMESGGAMRAR